MDRPFFEDRHGKKYFSEAARLGESGDVLLAMNIVIGVDFQQSASKPPYLE